MKVNLYMDVYSGLNITNAFYATSQPVVPKPKGWKRLLISVEVPDVYLTGEIDAALVPHEFKEVEKDLE